MNTLAKISEAITAAFNWLLEKTRLKNSAKLQANTEAKTDQQIKDDATKTVKDGNLTDIRKANSE